jgi:hypothetical protein
MEKSYDNFNWVEYVNKYIDLGHIDTKDEAWRHWDNHGKYENRDFFYNNDDYFYSLISNSDDTDKNLIELQQKFNDILDTKKNFDWIRYIDEYKDLVGILDQNQAWHHWILHGRREKRNLYVNKDVIINNTEIHNGRFGNLFFVNMVLHFISKKYNLKTTYKYYNKFLNLGIDLFVGNNTYNENTYLTEINYFDLISKKNNFTNIIVTNNSWFQNYEFCLFLEIYFNKKEIKNKIIQKNKFLDRYKNNNDLFIHVRLDDVEEMDSHNNFEYYDTIIKKQKYKIGYIASDNLNSQICCRLIQKYSLKIINLNEEETIMFGSTCNNIILSGGTFSWLIGFLAFYSENINYPINNKKWYGDIFVYKNWVGN